MGRVEMNSTCRPPQLAPSSQDESQYGVIPLAERTDAMIQVAERLVESQCAMISLIERT